MAETSSKRRRDAYNDDIVESSAVLRSTHWQTSYPVQFTSPKARSALVELGKEKCKEKNTARDLDVLLRILEAYLAVTNQTIDFIEGAFRPEKAVIGFFGALYSQKFLHAKKERRYVLARTWWTLTSNTSQRVREEVPRPSPRNQIDWYADARLAFEVIRLNSTQVYLWRGWLLVNATGYKRWLDFRSLYHRYGRQFTDGYANACRQLFSSRRAQDVPLAQAFADHIAGLPPSWSRKSLLNRRKMRKVLVGFLQGVAKDFAGRGLQYSTLCDQWGDFVFFLKTYLCNGRFVARPTMYPSLPTHELETSQTHRRVGEDGIEIVTKLLTELPLYLSNKETVEQLQAQITSDIEAIRRWATYETETLWQIKTRRDQLAKEGVPKEMRHGVPLKVRNDSVKREANNWDKNACATFEALGFSPSSDGLSRTFYPAPLDGLAFSLFALPTKGALIPHMALLILDNPKLTSSFFEDFILYDEHEQMTGLVKSDAGWILDGRKYRKGLKKAQQTIYLTPAGAEIVFQLIELTRPLREYLKQRQDPAWRNLFLHCGKGFSYPKIVAPSEEVSYKRLRRKEGSPSSQLEESFKNCGQVPDDDIQRLAAAFSLTSLRASVAVREYVKKPNIRRLAELLGHERVDVKLLRRYLPAPLLDFYQNRWVRLFHCGLLLQSLGDSPFALRATGFESLEEMSAFLANHALKWRPRESVGKDVATSTGAKAFDVEVVFSVSVENLSILQSLCLAISDVDDESLSPLARSWRDYAIRLFDYIENSSPPRDDFIYMLDLAKLQASQSLICRDALYA